MKKIILLLFVFTNAISFAQAIGSSLTIFSENGDKFYLVLNGKKINTEPQTNVKAEGLKTELVNVQILFEDKNLKMISENRRVMGLDNIFQDVTCKIKRKSNGKIVTRLQSMVPAVAPFNNLPPRGNNDPRNNDSRNNPPTQPNQGGVNVNVNIGGVQIGGSVPIGNPIPNQGNPNTGNPNTNYIGCVNKLGMIQADYDAAVELVKSKNFDNDMLKLAKQITSDSCLTLAQIEQMVKLFTRDESKLELLMHDYDFCIDPRNYFKLETLLTFNSGKEKFQAFLKTKNF